MAKNTLKLSPRTQNTPLMVWVWRSLFIAATVVILWKSLEPFHGSPGPPYTDKIRHFMAYLCLTGLAFLSRITSRQIKLLLAILVFSAAIEILQGLMNMGRTASYLDFVANFVGILFAWGLSTGLQSLKR